MSAGGDRAPTVAVVGLGYVGLPLVAAMHAAGLRIIGYDVDGAKIEKLARGENYIEHLGPDFARDLGGSGRFRPTSDEADIAGADAVVLCVPTPLGPHDEPDLSFVVRSTEMVARVVKDGALVVLESTTYPGTTRGVMEPIFRAVGKRVRLAYSPEREDPARAGYSTATIPKLVGGIDFESGRAAVELYSRFIDRVIEVSSAEVAEAAKLLENIYRAVNIALVNELKVILDRLGVDVWEVIEAASTKPFGYQAFYPGPGLGGHCIPVDPFYLTWVAKRVGHATKFIELAGEVNRAMPRFVVDRTAEALNDDGKPLKGSRVMIVGVAYKPDVSDIRETPAAEIITMLQKRGADVCYHDPHVPVFPAMRRYAIDLRGVPLDAKLVEAMDCVLIVTDHQAIDWSVLGAHAGLVVDTRNAMARAGAELWRGRVVKA